MAPKSKSLPLWDPYEIFDTSPNTRYLKCLEGRCWRPVNRKDTKAACARLDKMVLKDPSGIGEKSLTRLAVLCFCSKHREDSMAEDEIQEKVSEWLDRIEDVLEERDKELKKAKKAKKARKAKKKAKQEEESEVNRLLEEVNGLKEQLQRTVDENGTMSKKMSQLQKQVSEVENDKNNLQSATRVYAREKEQLEREMERIRKIAACSRETRIKEVDELKIQLQDSGARVEEAARHISDLKGQLEECNARIESIKGETSEEMRELKGQLDREREMTMELKELTKQLKESDTHLEESKSHHEVMERQTTAEIDKLRDQLDKSNASLGIMRQGSIKEASELKDQLTRCKHIIAELKAAESANMVQLECEANRRNYILKDCQTKIACDISGSRQYIDRDHMAAEWKAASSHEKNQLTEEVHGLKEQLCDGKAASTMPTSVLQMDIQNLRMWINCSVCSSYVHLLFKQRKAEQVETANSALADEVLRLREQARGVDTRLASQVENIFVLKRRDVKQGVWAATAMQLLKIAVKRALNISGNHVWLMFPSTGGANTVDVR